jgi:hypothetical protein
MLALDGTFELNIILATRPHHDELSTMRYHFCLSNNILATDIDFHERYIFWQ